MGPSFNFLHLGVYLFSVVCSQLLISNLYLSLNILEYSRYSKRETFHIKNREHTTDKHTHKSTYWVAAQLKIVSDNYRFTLMFLPFWYCRESCANPPKRPLYRPPCHNLYGQTCDIKYSEELFYLQGRFRESEGITDREVGWFYFNLIINWLPGA